MNDMKRYVVVFAPYYQDLNQILLVEKDRPTWMAGCLNLVGGKMENGETEYECALRELEEEAGLVPWRKSRYLSPSDQDVRLMGAIVTDQSYIYCMRIDVNTTQHLSPRPGETEKVAWHKWSEVWQDKRLMPNLRVVIPLMMAGVSAWFIRDTGPIKGRYEHEIGVKLLFGDPIMMGDEE